jgi:hypothetical protein
VSAMHGLCGVECCYRQPHAVSDHRPALMRIWTGMAQGISKITELLMTEEAHDPPGDRASAVAETHQLIRGWRIGSRGSAESHKRSHLSYLWGCRRSILRQLAQESRVLDFATR